MKKITDLTKQGQIISTEQNVPLTRPSIYIRTLNIMAAPFKKRYERHYKISKKHLVIDLIFVILILALAIFNIYLLTQKFPLPDFSISFNQQETLVEPENKSEPAVALSEIALTAEALYFNDEGDQLGFGAWPPKIGETSNLVISINLEITSGNWENIKFQAKLPKNITWIKSSSVNKGVAIVYDVNKNTIFWNIDSLMFNENANAVFNLEFTPTADAVGKKILLLENIFANGFNKESDKEFSVSAKNLYSPVVQ